MPQISAGVSAQGWRSRMVPIPRPAGEPAIVELRSGGFLTHFSAMGGIDTEHVRSEDDHVYVTSTTGTKPFLFVLAPKHTHVKVKRHGGDSGGIARWHLRTIAPESLRKLESELEGDGGEVLSGSRGGEFSFSFEQKDGVAGFVCTDFRGNPMDITHEGHMRGRVKIPGPGYITVVALGPWKLKRL
ncbi:hypothetical protein [Streptomyces sp. NPDC059452]|uniref:hypothetical protein n=1 Tax=Streptomyces sp. NPDC059452 TaxID=3346835 RepID=UPI0036829221